MRPINYTDPVIKSLITEVEYGLEKESLRVNPDGRLAQTKHYFDDPCHISRDFCENQPEFITDVFTDAEILIAQMGSLHESANQRLRERGELLWSFSNPPLVESESEIREAELDAAKSAYRHYLAGKYGKAKMLFCGIHLNLSFPENVLDVLFERSGEGCRKTFVSQLYTSLAQKFVKYGWLIVYFTAASPVADRIFLKMIGAEKRRFASYRCGELGYWNFFTPIIDFSTVEGYVKSINAYISDGKLISPSELYYPVRLKSGADKGLEKLTEDGITHIELRMLDLNPLSEVGIFSEDIEFIHVLALYLLSLEDDNLSEEEQIEAINNVKTAALYDDEAAKIGDLSLREAALGELGKIIAFTEKYFPEYTHLVRCQLDKVENHKRYAEIIYGEYSENYIEKGIELAKKYRG